MPQSWTKAPSKGRRDASGALPPFTGSPLRASSGAVFPETLPSSILFIRLTTPMGTDPSLGLGEGHSGDTWSPRGAGVGDAWGACQRNAVELLGFQGNCAGPRIPSSASWNPHPSRLHGALTVPAGWRRGRSRNGPPYVAWFPQHDWPLSSAQPVAGRELAPGGSGMPPAHSTANYFP